MLSPHTTLAHPRLVATPPGVPEAQARDLDRRRRLRRQLQSFRAIDRASATAPRPLPAVTEAGGPGPA